jgi:hypothetical protein
VNISTALASGCVQRALERRRVDAVRDLPALVVDGIDVPGSRAAEDEP